MEEESTQPATQIVIDPRRLGEQNSGLDHKDLGDIFCILHPASPPAYRACASIAKADPKRALIANSAEVKFRDDKNDEEVPPDPKHDTEPHDIVLRLSAELKDSFAGHCFGRYAARCDYVIGDTEINKRVSNIHFRIYINEHGTIMLEDQSTNGTIVDDKMLRAKEKENGKMYRQTLVQGSIIRLVMVAPDVDYKFIVRIPQRNDADEFLFQENLTRHFLSRKARLEDKKNQAVGKAGAKEPPNLFPTQPHSSTSKSRTREWKGGSTYNKVGTIGKGAFAVVYKVTRKYDGQPFAAKELEKRRFMKNGILDQKVDSEMMIMRKIKHPNIVQFIEHVDWDDYLYIIMDFVPGGDLGTLVSINSHLDELVVKDMAAQLLSALNYLHQMGITHRDVKPDNILIQNDMPFHVKLTDFGLSKMVDSEETFLRTFCGTLLYCAPEVYSEYREYDSDGRRTLRGSDRKALPPQRYGHAVDIWSLAGVLFYALCKQPPFPVKNGTSYQELLNRIMTEPLDIRPLQRANVSENGIRFVRSMLHVRPQHRATIAELEASAWFRSDNVESSMEDEVDEDQIETLRDGFVDSNEEDLEQSASQLSLGEADGQANDSGDFNSSDITEIQHQPEIPSSFNTSDSISDENSLLVQTPAGAAGQGRLFGEVGGPAVGSSGALPLSGHEFPVPFRLPVDPRLVLNMDNRFEDSNMTDDSKDSFSTDSMPSIEISRQDMQSEPSPAPTASKAMPPPPVPPFDSVVQDYDADRRAERSSSLMGTESLVGHLRMRSPTDTPSPAAERLDSPVPETIDNRTSLRRPREPENGVEDWWPAEVPAPKRHKSARAIDIQLPSSIFWDLEDKSTQHHNYPRLYNSQYNAFVEAAKAKGEKFKPGEAFFDTAMQSFRSSRSPSLEPEVHHRATSEPTKQEGRRILMKRDDRKLEAKTYEAAHTLQDNAIPATARGSNMNMTGVPASNTESSASAVLQPTIENDFQLPKRILAKFSGTKDSVLPTIILNIVDSVTSWGRGFANTVRYQDGQQIKIPKYAFKILLHKPGFYDVTGASYDGEPWNGSTEMARNFTFYISSKATTGIWVNGVNLPSYDRQNPATKSKFWGELHHGDEVTVWQHDINPKEFTRFKFECYLGKSAEARKESFRALAAGDLVSELDHVCLAKEHQIFEEKRLKAEAEIQKQTENGGQLSTPSSTPLIQRNKSAPALASRHHDVYQSFAGTPSFEGTAHNF